MADGEQRRPIATVLAATALSIAVAIAIDVAFGWLRPQPESRLEALKVRPSADRVYLLGNSIFKTGIDVQDLEVQLGGAIGDRRCIQAVANRRRERDINVSTRI